ncbi:HAD family hydrolase [Spirochaeta cellobiosiphila]|uniref:HAD family hydrolase n=1 Tax=Spirochaeta cellobiosiphila TaxID=504483 RepID=UPI0003FB191D|nr:HAD family hydrolase [Spirochaeta cellobiosiphila]
MKFDLVVSDLDGTILNNKVADRSWLEVMRAGVRRLQDRNIKFTIATGRPEISALPIARELGIDTPIITYNGAQIINREGTVLYENTYDLKHWEPFLYNLLERGGSVVLYREGEALCLEHSDRIKQYEVKENIPCRRCSWSDIRRLSTYKILLLGDMDLLKSVWAKCHPGQDQEYQMFQSESDHLEIVGQGISKGTALVYLAEYLHVSLGSTIAIGNHYNDMDMLKAAQLGIAVANAEPGLQSTADFVTRHAYEDGVIEMINRWVLKEELENA